MKFGGETNVNIGMYVFNDIFPLSDSIFDYSDYKFIEPSVGKGSFVKTSNISLDKWILFELDDSIDSDYSKQTTYGDFLKTPIINGKNITIGNPPFGKRSKLAIEFINK